LEGLRKTRRTNGNFTINSDDEEDEQVTPSTPDPIVANNSVFRPDFTYNGPDSFQQQSLAGQHWIAKTLEQVLAASTVKDSGENIYKKHQHFIQVSLVTYVMGLVRINLDPVFSVKCLEYQEGTLRKLVAKIGPLDEGQIEALKKRIAEVMATFRNYIRTIVLNALVQMPVRESQIKTGMFTVEGLAITDSSKYQPIIEGPNIQRVFINLLKESVRSDIARYKWEEVYIGLLANSIWDCYTCLKAKRPKDCPGWFYDATRVQKVYDAWQKREDKDKLKAQRAEWLQIHTGIPPAPGE